MAHFSRASRRSFVPAATFFAAHGLAALSLGLASMPAARAQTALPSSNRIVASDGTGNARFGNSLAVSGNIGVSGANGADNGQGASYLFNAATGQQTAKLTASDASSNAGFGSSVALSGNTAVIGASGSNSGQGSAYLFNAATGQQTGRLTASDGAANANFGNAVALSGNTALIAANQANVGGQNYQGAAYLYNVTTGQQTAKLTASDGVGGDFFGNAVSISGNNALVGSSFYDRPSAFGPYVNQGAAYLFNATTGQQTAKFIASDGDSGDTFGNAVALSGNFALIGAYGDNGGVNNQISDQGSAYLFDVITGQQLFKFTASDGGAYDLFGCSVALSGNLAFIGAYGDDGSRGSVYAFDLTTGQQVNKFFAADGDANDFFGYSLATNNGNVVTGAVGDAVPNSNQGSAYRIMSASVAVPEPGTFALLSVAALPLLGIARRRRNTPVA